LPNDSATSSASEWAERIAWVIEQYDGDNREAAARRIGSITRQGLSRIIRERTVPGADNLAAIARAYPRISPAWLLTGEGPRERGAPTGTAAVREVLDAVERVVVELRARWGV
jgi:hypothetical protein